jgi:hypothetical protein
VPSRIHDSLARKIYSVVDELKSALHLVDSEWPVAVQRYEKRYEKDDSSAA